MFPIQNMSVKCLPVNIFEVSKNTPKLHLNTYKLVKIPKSTLKSPKISSGQSVSGVTSF